MKAVLQVRYEVDGDGIKSIAVGGPFPDSGETSDGPEPEFNSEDAKSYAEEALATAIAWAHASFNGASSKSRFNVHPVLEVAVYDSPFEVDKLLRDYPPPANAPDAGAPIRSEDYRGTPTV